MIREREKTGGSAPMPMPTTTAEASLVTSILQTERRKSPRFSISRPLLACPFGPEYTEAVHTSSNTSRDGVYFETRAKHYCVGMPISVSAPYAGRQNAVSPSFGKVVRVDRFDDGRLGVAVRILMR
jgi:hypothetical protein